MVESGIIRLVPLKIFTPRRSNKSDKDEADFLFPVYAPFWREPFFWQEVVLFGENQFFGENQLLGENQFFGEIQFFV